MGFCFPQNISETHKFEMFVFSYTFPVLWKSPFFRFWKLHGLLLQVKNIRNPLKCLKCLCFPIFFHYYGNSLFPCFENCMDSMEKSLQIIEWERYRYSYLFSMNWEKIFLNFFKSPQLGNYMAFHRIFPCYGNLDIPRHWGLYK